MFFWQISCILSYFFIKVALFSNLSNSINFFLSNQKQFKINTSSSVKNKYETLIKNSLENKEYQQNIQICIDKLEKIIFNNKIISQISKKCTLKSRKNRSKCSLKSKSTFKIRKSLKGKEKTLTNIVLTTRMSLFEL